MKHEKKKNSHPVLNKLFGITTSFALMLGMAVPAFAEDAQPSEEPAVEPVAEEAPAEEETPAIVCAANSYFDAETNACICNEGFENYTDESGCSLIVVEEPTVEPTVEATEEPAALPTVETTAEPAATTEAAPVATTETPIVLGSPAGAPPIMPMSSSNTVTVEYWYYDGVVAFQTDQQQFGASTTLTITYPVIGGYVAHIEGESVSSTSLTATDDGTDQVFKVIYDRTAVDYTVTHKYTNLDGSYTTTVENKSGLPGGYTDAQPIITTGFVVNGEIEQILLDPQLVGTQSFNVDIIYDRIEYNVVYHTNGGDPIASEFAKYESSLTTLPTPTKAGYVFVGWHLMSDLSDAPVTSVTNITADVHLYAEWTPGAAVPVTIQYYVQPIKDGTDVNTDLASYELDSVDSTQTMIPGTEINTTVFADDSGFNLDKNINYFTYDQVPTVTVAGDGTTIIKAYYSRNKYTIAFDLRNSTAAVDYNGSSVVAYSFDAYYQADISKLWPLENNLAGYATLTHTDESIFHGWRITGSTTIWVSRRYTLTAELIVNNTNPTTSTYYAEWTTTPVKYKLYYMGKVLPETACTISTTNWGTCYNGYLYEEIPGMTQSATTNATGSNWMGKDIEGYDVWADGAKHQEGVAPSDGAPALTDATYNNDGITDVFFFYNRAQITVSFYNYDHMIASGSGASKQPASVYVGGTIPTAVEPVALDDPSTTDDDGAYTFGGWYRDSNCTSGPVDFATEPGPTINTIYYAKWVEHTLDVTFDYQDGTTANVLENVVVGGNATEPSVPSRPGFVFMGWYENAAGTGTRYNFTTAVTANKTLYAKWLALIYTSYKVNYVEQGTGVVLKTPVTRSAVVGTNVVVEASPIAGYFVVNRYGQINDIPDTPATNIINFEYVQISSATTVTVNYLKVDASGNTIGTMRAPITRTGVMAATWTEYAPTFTGYTLQGIGTQTIPVSSVATSNVINFKYKANPHTLTINATFAAGETASASLLPNAGGWINTGSASTYTSTVGTAESYSVAIPPIAGYSIRLVGGAAIGSVAGTMPNGDVTVNVEYYSTPVPPTPTPGITPTPAPRTCQDDGYPAGYYWNGTACVIDPTPTPIPPVPPVVPTPTPAPATPTPTATATPVVTVNPTPSASISTEGTTKQPEFGADSNRWALVNLVCAIVSMLLGIVLLFKKNNKEDEMEEESIDTETETDKYHRNGIYKTIGTVLGIASIVVFALTENLANQMAMVDQYTLWMVVLALGSAVTFGLGSKWKKADEEDNVTE